MFYLSGRWDKLVGRIIVTILVKLKKTTPSGVATLTQKPMIIRITIERFLKTFGKIKGIQISI
jgi:hypothetical protein